MQCAEICRSTWDASGYYGGRFEAVAFFPRKPLIWKREEIWPFEARSAVRIALDQAGIYVYPPGPMGGYEMKSIFRKLWREEQGQDIAEYAVMLAVILVIVVGTIRLIGSNANNVFSSVASSVQ